MLFILLALSFAQLAFSKVVYHDWNITWVTAAPDGFARPVIGINGQWPCPTLRADLGDRVIVTVNNQLGNQSTSLHWHGITQNGTQHMDGATGATQCPIPPGETFVYDWVATNPGTYWYHSHSHTQYPDGLWGPLIIDDPNPPFEYDEEIILTLSDWYHEQVPDLINLYQSQAGAAPDGVPPPSGGGLINSGKDVKIHVKPNKTYLVRVICVGSYPGHAWLFDEHPVTTVEVDGVYTKPQPANTNSLLTRIAPGQRQSVLIKTKNDTSKNYAMFDALDVNMLFINKGIIPPPMDYPMNTTAWLVYDDAAPLPPPPVFHKLGDDNFFDDLNYEPLDEQPLLGPVDHQIILDTNSLNVSGISRFEVNNHTYIGQKVPSLYSALSFGEEYAANPIIYGQTNPIVVKHNQIIEIVINNRNTNLHPWHMHGRQFQFLDRPNPHYGPFNGTYRPGFPHANPIRRDTVMVQDDSWAVIRFRADNPGIWLLHCHIEFHVGAGFTATIVEAPEVLAERGFMVPKGHIETCKKFPMSFRGNAAGNVRDPLDLSGATTELVVPDYGAMYPPGTPPHVA